MTIKIVREPDIHLTPGELARYSYDFQNFMAYYAGPPMTLEEYIRAQQRMSGAEHVRRN